MVALSAKHTGLEVLLFLSVFYSLEKWINRDLDATVMKVGKAAWYHVK